MTGTIEELIYAGAAFLGIHFLIPGTPLRRLIVDLIGERVYRALFAIAAALTLVWYVAAYSAAPHEPLWAGGWLGYGPVIAMPFALLLLVCAFSSPNPTSVGLDAALASPAVGIFRVTRHPFLWAIALWAATHLLANGDVASLVFFGGLLVLALIGPFLIDARLRRRAPEVWQRFAAATSLVPLVAILAGRNSLQVKEIGWWRLALAVAIYLFLLYIHPRIFGMPALPV